MGTSLNGLTPSATYTGLLKFGDNTAISASLKAISDGAGNDTILELSTTALQIGGSTGVFWDNTNKRLGIGTNTPLYNLDVVETSGSLDAVFTNSDATSNITFYQDNDQAKGLRLQSYGSTAPGTLLDGTINRANSTVYRTNDASNPMVFGGFATSSEQVYFGKNSFTLALNNTTNNVTIGASSGTARLFIKGAGTTSATTSLLVENSAGTDMLGIYDNGRVFLGNAGVNQPYIINFDGSSTEGGNGQAIRIRQQANINGILMQYFADGLFNNTTSGNNVSHDFLATGYRGNTGSGNYNALRLSYTINNISGSTQTGTARGISVNATETSLEGMLHKLMDLQVGGSSKFEVLSTGSTAVSINSTTQGFLPPRMTTTQRDAIATPASGLQVYDSTVNRASVYSTAWENVITEVNASPNSVSNIWSGSQAQYDALTPNASTLYFIV
jgi:hypothetical protein